MQKTMLVTGGSKRVGRFIVEHFARLQYKIVFQYHHSEQDAKQMLVDFSAAGLEVRAIQADLSESHSAEKLVRYAIDQFGRLDVLINNASVLIEKSLAELTPFDFEQNMSINLRAPILLTQAFAKYAQAGHIINFLDRSITSHRDDQISYLLSKKALAEFTQMAAVSLAPHFRVNGIAPGRILPRVNESIVDPNILVKKIPLQREGKLSDITDAVEALERMTYVTGQIIYVAGGKQIRK